MYLNLLGFHSKFDSPVDLCNLLLPYLGKYNKLFSMKQVVAYEFEILVE